MPLGMGGMVGMAGPQGPPRAMGPAMARPGAQIPGMAPMARPGYKYTPAARNSGQPEAQQGVVVAGQVSADHLCLPGNALPPSGAPDGHQAG